MATSSSSSITTRDDDNSSIIILSDERNSSSSSGEVFLRGVVARRRLSLGMLGRGTRSLDGLDKMRKSLLNHHDGGKNKKNKKKQKRRGSIDGYKENDDDYSLSSNGSVSSFGDDLEDDLEDDDDDDDGDDIVTARSIVRFSRERTIQRSKSDDGPRRRSRQMVDTKIGQAENNNNNNGFAVLLLVLALLIVVVVVVSFGFFFFNSNNNNNPSSIIISNLRKQEEKSSNIVIDYKAETQQQQHHHQSVIEFGNNNNNSSSSSSRRQLQPLVFDYQVTIPSTADTITAIDLTNVTPTDGMVKLLVEVSSADELVIVHLTTPTLNYIPVSRSYDGHDWETVSGLYSSLHIECATDGNRKCVLTVPAVMTGESYQITRYTRTVSDRVKVSRFLERATFGPNLAEIDAFDTTTLHLAMAQYVQDLIDKPVDSHREFWRRHLNNRKLETYKHGISGPKPCDQFSRWRIFAFTKKDQMASEKEALKMKIETKIVNSSTVYVLSFGGFPRTVLYQPLKYIVGTGEADVPDGEYWLTYVEAIAGSKREARPTNDSPETLKILSATDTTATEMTIIGGNPIVHLDPDALDSTGYHELDLSSSSVSKLDIEYSGGSTFLLEDELSSSTCLTLDDPEDDKHKSFRYDCEPTLAGDCDHYLDNSWRSPKKTVFGKLPDTEGGGYALYDRRLVLDENTIENPLIDGGGNKVCMRHFSHVKKINIIFD